MEQKSVKSSGILVYQNKPIHFEYHPSENYSLNTTILLGGVLQDMASWKNYIREFSKTNNIIVVDLPGVGQSGVLDHSWNFEFLADCLNEVIVTIGIDSVNIFSTSYSTIIAFEFAKKYSAKVSKLVISSSMTEIPEDQMNIMLDCLTAIEKNDDYAFSQLFLSGIANQLQKPANSELVARVISSGIRNMNRVQLEQFKQNTLRVLNYNLTANTNCRIEITPLIFTGEIDNFTPPELCKKIGYYFEDFHFRTIPGLDHLFHIGNNQLIFSNLIPYFNLGIVPDFGMENNSVKNRELVLVE